MRYVLSIILFVIFCAFSYHSGNDAGTNANRNYSRAITADYTMTAQDSVVFVTSNHTDNTGITLPSANGIMGQNIFVYKTDTTTAPVSIIPAGSDTIVGLTGLTLRAKGASQGLRSDGVDTWYPIGKLIHDISYLGKNVDPTSAAAGVSSTSYYSAITVDEPCVIYGIRINVGTQSGSIDVGIYDSALARVVSSGSTACPASGKQTITIADTLLQPGIYYLAIAPSDATATFGRVGSSDFTGYYSQSTNFPLGTTATLGHVSARCYTLVGIIYGGITL